MGETERRRVQHEPRRWDRGSSGAEQVANVDRFTDDGVAAFGEVDPDLMRAAGLEPDAAQRRVREPTQRLDVGDRVLGVLPLLGVAGRAADAIAPIGDQVRFDPHRADVAKLNVALIEAKDFASARLTDELNRTNNKFPLVSSLWHFKFQFPDQLCLRLWLPRKRTYPVQW